MKEIVRHHPLAIGELVWDDARCEWATISMFGDESVGNHFVVLKNDNGEIWETDYENVYQIAPGVYTRYSGDIICYEHNETEDEYPYYCPALQENFFSFEVVSELE